MTALVPSSEITSTDRSRFCHPSDPYLNELHIPDSLNLLGPIAVYDLIRVGPHYDGGYIVSMSAVKETECLLWFRMTDDWSLDAHFLRLKPKVTLSV